MINGMMKKSCVAALGSYLLGKRTIFLPQGGLVRADGLEPTDANIRNLPKQTRLYGTPRPMERNAEGQGRRERLNRDFDQDDRQTLSINENWDAMEGYNPPDNEGNKIRRALMFYAPYERVDYEHTARGKAQHDIDFERITDANETRKCYEGGFEKWFPVDRTDPPHSDLVVRGDHDAKKDFWLMEYAFRKICHRPLCHRPEQLPRENEENAPKIQAERYFEVPKNVIAYFVQRILQFPPETFGRFRISDGSYTAVTVNCNGKPKVYCIGTTSHFAKGYEERRNVPEDGLVEDVGLEVPGAGSDDTGEEDRSDHTDSDDCDDSDDTDSSDDSDSSDDDSDDDCDDGSGGDYEPSDKKIKLNENRPFGLF